MFIYPIKTRYLCDKLCMTINNCMTHNNLTKKPYIGSNIYKILVFSITSINKHEVKTKYLAMNSCLKICKDNNVVSEC